MPEYEIELINPLRRFYMKPLDWVENNIIRKYINSHPVESAVHRSNISKLFIMWMVGATWWYYIQYNHNTWESNDGIKVAIACPRAWPGDPRYPIEYTRSRGEHADFSFSKRKVYLDLDSIEITPN